MSVFSNSVDGYRFFLWLILLFPFQQSLAQEHHPVDTANAGLEIRLKSVRQSLSIAPHHFDSILLKKSFRETVKTFYDVQRADSVFRIAPVPVGKFRLYFSSKEADVEPLSITVCSKCESEFFFKSSTPKNDGTQVVFQTVEISPVYQGDLAGDFQGGLTRKERRLIKKSKDFTVHFFVTRQGAISDISFLPADLPEAVQNAVSKGLQNLTTWRAGELNGRPVDDEYLLSKSALLNR